MNAADSSGRADYLTREHILKLLSDGEVASVSTAETQGLRRGDEYVDLEQLQQGVQRAEGPLTKTGSLLPRKAIHEDTWRRVLRELKAMPVKP